MAGFRFHTALVAAKVGAKLMRLLGRNASHAPGVIAQKLCPTFLKEAPKPPLSICVTGTNGKTTVANLLTDALEADGQRVVSNRSGSNIVPGCTTNVINSLNWRGKCRVDAAVFEVDERASRLILPYLKPDYLVVTNLFRDSLKRNAHPDYIFSILDTYCPDETKLILNADDLCSSRLKLKNERVYYGIAKQDTDRTESINLVTDYALCPLCDTKLTYDYLRYHHIGHAHCPACHFESPEADYVGLNINAESNTLTVDAGGEIIEFPLVSPVTFNVYNEMCVIATLFELSMGTEQVKRLVSAIRLPDSRFGAKEAGGVKVIRTVGKGQNSVSVSRAFDYVANEKGDKVVVLAMDDAHDRLKSVEYIGWIYDVDYELLNSDSIKQIVAAGPRALDHKARLLLAGVPEERIACAMTEMDGVDCIDTTDADTVIILHDVYTYEVSCRMQDTLIERLEGAQ